jgi:hypothetical protein
MVDQMTEGSQNNSEEEFITRKQIEEVTKFSFL